MLYFIEINLIWVHIFSQHRPHFSFTMKEYVRHLRSLVHIAQVTKNVVSGGNILDTRVKSKYQLVMNIIVYNYILSLIGTVL